MSLVAMALAFVMTQDSPLPILEIGTLPDSGYVSLLAMDGEGRWVGWGDHKGQVEASEAAEIKKAIDEARLSTVEGPRCTTTPVLQLVRTRRGEVRFAETCGPMAHPTLSGVLGPTTLGAVIVPDCASATIARHARHASRCSHTSVPRGIRPSAAA